MDRCLSDWLWREWRYEFGSLFDLGAMWGLSDREVEDEIRRRLGG